MEIYTQAHKLSRQLWTIFSVFLILVIGTVIPSVV